MSENLLSISQAARFAEVSEATVRRDCALGRIKHVLTPCGRLVDGQDLARYKAEREARRELVPA